MKKAKRRMPLVRVPKSPWIVNKMRPGENKDFPTSGIGRSGSSSSSSTSSSTLGKSSGFSSKAVRPAKNKFR